MRLTTAASFESDPATPEDIHTAVTDDKARGRGVADVVSMGKVGGGEEALVEVLVRSIFLERRLASAFGKGCADFCSCMGLCGFFHIPHPAGSQPKRASAPGLEQAPALQDRYAAKPPRSDTHVG